MTAKRFFSAFILCAALALAPLTAKAQALPPVFKDATDNGAGRYSAPASGQPAPPPAPTEQAQTQTEAQTEAAQDPQADLPVDPCAAYMDDYNAYTFCTDRYQKIDRMKAGSDRRRKAYSPPPPKEETKPAETETPAEGEKTEEAKQDGGKEGEAKTDDAKTAAEPAKTDAKKTEAPESDAKN